MIEQKRTIPLGELLDEIEWEIEEDEETEERSKNQPAQIRPIWFAYTDGSYNKAEEKYGYGVIVVENGEVIRKEHGCGYPSSSENGWNINGELAAAEHAVQMAIENNCKELMIFHDYEGVGKWADHQWNTSKNYVREYIRFIEDARNTLKISFVHVKGHSGNKYNEMADTQAGIGAGLIQEETAENTKTSSYKNITLPEGLTDEGKASITTFMNISGKRSFRDFVNLKTGGKDAFSTLTESELLDKLGLDFELTVLEHLNNIVTNNVVSALRWGMRGLHPEDAAEKVNVQEKVWENIEKNA
jgi:ribonuclease HI